MDWWHTKLPWDAQFVRDRHKFTGEDCLQLAAYSALFREIQAERFNTSSNMTPKYIKHT